MSNRNFEFRVSPRHGQRGARYTLDTATSAPVPSGAPVTVSTSNDGLGRQVVQLATGVQDKPLPGKGGMLVFESINNAGSDPLLSTYSDADVAEAGSPVQVISGANEVKVAFTNTLSGGSFLLRSGYPAERVMVAGVSIGTPTVEVGGMLTPGDGTDADGYWAETNDASKAWLIVTAVDGDTVEAKLNF